MWNIVIVPLLTLMILLMNIPISDIYAENGEYSKFNSLKLRHDTNPNVCLFEVNPDIYDDWEGLKYITISAIEEWIIKLENFYPNGDWGVSIETISWVEHENKKVEKFTNCNIMINYEKLSGGNALGTTSLNFNQSWHKFMFINVFLESEKVKTLITLGDGLKNTTVERIGDVRSLSLLAIKNVIVHEFGHGIGLGHYNSDKSHNVKTNYMRSVMVPYIDPFNINQELYVTYLDIVMIGEIYGENGWNKPTPVYPIKGCNIKLAEQYNPFFVFQYIFKCY